MTIKDLTKEKNLWQIYRASRKIKGSKFNIATICLFVALLTIYAFYSNTETAVFVEQTRKAAEISFGVALSTLGFLIAGYTIFATITQPDLAVSMSELTHEESGLSWLKHSHFIFVRVFVHYIGYITLCLVIIALGHVNGPLKFDT